MAEISFDTVTKRYGDGTDAVKSLSLDIADGEFMILVGPSGCGKSTALRMVAGLEEVSSGELRIGGHVVNDTAPRDRDVAMVFQSYALYPHMTIRKNMGFALKLAGVNGEEIDRRVGVAARVLDLEDHLDRKPAHLSGGQRQRVAMGRAIVRSPQAFLMDEPLSNLDAKLRVQMRAEVARIQSRLGATTLYVTHDQTEAMTLGDRVAVMHGGVMQQVASPKELYECPTNVFVGGFIGSPAMSFLPAVIEADSITLPMGRAPLPASWAGVRPGRALAGVRPEHFAEARRLGDSASGLRFTAAVALVESVGSDVFAHLDVPIDPALGRGIDAGQVVAEPTGDIEVGAAPRVQGVVARLGPGTPAAAGGRVDLLLDLEGLHLFDAETHQRLERP
jgi:multiple sugar transport system ATP-binding protein